MSTVTVAGGGTSRDITLNWIDAQGNTATKHIQWLASSTTSDANLGTLLTSLDNLSMAALRSVTENVGGIASGQKSAPSNPANVPISVVFYLVFVSNLLNAAGHSVEREIPIYAPGAGALFNANAEIDVTNPDVAAIIALGPNLIYPNGQYFNAKPVYNMGMTFSASRSAEVTQARIVSH